jgi:SAM-dependent methyltransferase
MESFLEENGDCLEGILTCENCGSKFPIIAGVGIIVGDFSTYAANRVQVFGNWIVETKSAELRAFLREKGMTIHKSENNMNRYDDSEWFRPFTWTHYEYSLDDRMLSMLRWKIRPDEIYRKVANLIENSMTQVGLDLGCSVGSAALLMAKKLSFVFGIDLSFSFISEARRRMKEKEVQNVEFIVCDSTKMPFGQKYFDIVAALNLIGRLDLENTIQSVNNLIKSDGKLFMADPYDVDNNIAQGTRSRINGAELRRLLEKSGYSIMARTKKSESFIPWIVKINQRCYLFYFVDFIEARRKKGI